MEIKIWINNYIKEVGASTEEKKIAEISVQKEKSALDKWFNDDVSGYAELWSKRSFSYIDAVVKNGLIVMQKL